MASNFSSLSLGQLRTELRKRNAKLSGRKKELIERLEAYERNRNFYQNDDLPTEFAMELPKVGEYKDVHSEVKISPITYKHACEFLRPLNVDFDRTVIDLYDNKFLLYLRFCLKEKLDFIKSSCHAEMKKKITYMVDISLKKDGYVHEAQCECAAGEGPQGHCKHIRTVLYACCSFVKQKHVKVELTCTEKLQSFHKVNQHKGSPLKAKNLNMAGADEVSNFQDIDPRPPQYRNSDSYKDYFYNLCMNFKGISDMPIFQTFKPANIRAYTHDHNYLKNTPEDIFLKASKLSEISYEDHKYLEEVTRGQNSNDRWHVEREKRLQSSNFYRICNATEKTDLNKLADSIVSGSTIKSNEAMRHGQTYEREAVHLYETDFNVKVKNCGIFVSKTSPFLGASPDGVVNDEVICEVKCPFSAKDKDISPVTVPYLKLIGENLQLSVKHPYFYQIQGQLFCSGRNYCDLIVYTLADIKYIRIQKDNEFIAQMLKKLQNFYEQYFKSAVLKKFLYKEY